MSRAVRLLSSPSPGSATRFGELAVPEEKVINFALEEILESDRSITLNAESSLGSLKDKFSQIKKGSQGPKAYSTR